MRITNDIRKQIINNVLKASGLLKREHDNRMARAKWAEKARIKSIGGPKSDAKIKQIEAEWSDIKKTLPKQLKGKINEQLFYTKSSIWCNVCGKRDNPKFEEYDEKTNTWSYRLCVSGDVTITADDPLGVEWTDLQNELETIKNEIASLKKQVQAVVDSVYSDKKLLEIWPEAIAYLPSTEEIQKDKDAVDAMLPAINTEQINQRIAELSKKAA